MAKVNILSIDGGGIKGIIPATVLAAVESITRRQSFDMFDYIAGTSTGGIIALGLVRQNAMPAQRLLEFYQQYGCLCFDCGPGQAFTSLGNLAGPRYSATGIEGQLGRVFGNETLQNCRSTVLVPAYDIEKRQAVVFKNTEGSDNYFMRDVARSTSAAPTYFSPSNVQNLTTGEWRHFVDGGIFAGNPAVCAVAQALHDGHDAADISLLSLGCGNAETPILYESVKSWGLAMWAAPLFDMILDASAASADFQARQLVGKYLRVNTAVGVPENSSLDDCSEENIKMLSDVGVALSELSGVDLRKFCADHLMVR